MMKNAYGAQASSPALWAAGILPACRRLQACATQCSLEGCATHRRFFSHQRGLTFVEMMIVVAIIMVLSAIVLPVAKFSVRRQREIELKRDLRMLRDAIDAYHEAAVPSTPGATPKIQTKFGTDGWPPTLEALVEGETMIGDVKGQKLRFLRRIPKDPITNSYEWGLRSSQDEPDSKTWGGENLWDVYCKAHVLSLDGVTYYDEW